MNNFKNKALTEKEGRIQAAIAAYRAGVHESINKATDFHGVPKSTLKHRLAGRLARIPVQKQEKLQLLSAPYEDVMVDWCTELYSWGFSVRYDLLREMAGMLAGRPAGRRWPGRFMRRHPQLVGKMSRTLENKRGHAENPTVIVDFFKKFNELRAKYSLLNSNIYNVDEKRFMKEFASKSKIIVLEIHKNRKFTLHDENRESVMMIECINVVKDVLPSMVVFSSKSH
jgi:hypothetical protein